MSKVTVAIPTYNRREFLEESIKSVLNQTFDDFDIIIFDNNSDYDIASVTQSFHDPRIKLIRNSTNIGNTENFKKIYSYNFNSKYFIIFHDDDVMHPELLQNEVSALDNSPEAVFVGTNLNFIKVGAKMFEFAPQTDGINLVVLNNGSDLTRLLLKDFDLCFSSIMYRVADLKDFDFDKAPFFKWWDRPFLVKLSENKPLIIIKNKLVNYRIHGDQDSQADSTDKKGCLFNLFRFYRNSLPQPLNVEDKRLFGYFSTNQLIMSGLLFSKNFNEYINFIKLSKKKGLLSFKYLNIRGLFYFSKVLKTFFFKIFY